MTVCISEETFAAQWSQPPFFFVCRNNLSCVVIFTLSKGTQIIWLHLFLYSNINREVDGEVYGHLRTLLWHNSYLRA